MLVVALLIRQGSALLLLDEPTNHLDLEMRLAPSVALLEYTGALVVITRDHDLLRCVCDELLIVYDGVVDRFHRSLDDCPAWFQEQAERSAQAVAKWKDDPAKPVNREWQRQKQTEQRKRPKPLRDKMRKVEKALDSNHSRLAELEARLADQSIYSDPGRQDELTQLIQDQAAVKSRVESLEGEWQEASEELECAQ